MTGDKVGNSEDGNEVIMNSEPGAGVVPEDPSATTFVYSWVSFLAPISTRRAFNQIMSFLF